MFGVPVTLLLFSPRSKTQGVRLFQRFFRLLPPQVSFFGSTKIRPKCMAKAKACLKMPNDKRGKVNGCDVSCLHLLMEDLTALEFHGNFSVPIFLVGVSILPEDIPNNQQKQQLSIPNDSY